MKNIFTDEEFNKVKITAEEAYEKIGDVRCPFLGGTVAFNVKGLNHLKLKRWNHAREQKDQWVRLKLLHLAPEVLKKSNTLQGFDEVRKLERIKVNSRWEMKAVTVVYYEFISVLQGCRLRIIVKKIGDGPPYFWSIVPYWKQGAYKKKLFDGDPEID
ncbi:MAG: hypothetical protein WAZ40_03545 [Minisyncoccia bacterium]